MNSWRGLCFLLWIMFIGQGQAQLKENFYSSTCPSVEWIVNQAVSKKLRQTFTTIPATLRLFFHDCLVEVTTNSFTKFFNFFYVWKCHIHILKVGHWMILCCSSNCHKSSLTFVQVLHNACYKNMIQLQSLVQ